MAEGDLVGGAVSSAVFGTAAAKTRDDALLRMTISQQEFDRVGLPDLSGMTEEKQIAQAI